MKPDHTNDSASEPRWLGRRRVLAAAVVAALMANDWVTAQAPKWMLPLGASLSEQDTGESRPRPTRLPDVSGPNRLPMTSMMPERFESDVSAPTQLAAAGSGLNSPSDDAAPVTTLLAPQAITIAIDENLPITRFDRSTFDRSIEASLASSLWPDRQPWCDADATPIFDPCVGLNEYCNDFSPTPLDEASMVHDPFREQWAYDFKGDVPTQHPWIEWGRIFYGNGITPPGLNWFGEKNLVRPKFYLYGDFRSGIATGRNDVGRTDNWANRLNLDMDLQVTDTERFHAFVGPIDRGGRFSRLELVEGDLRFQQEIDLNLATGFFEGDLGVMMGAAQERTSPFELPVTIGLIPLLFQNGIWMEDAVTGAAFALPARHSRLLNWSNFDATFFAVVDQLNSPAFGADKHAAQAFGTAWFIEAYHGYIEAGYAYLRDRNNSARSYHNITASYTRRYFDRISNSVRVIVNAGQDLPQAQRTADGALLLCENSWITSAPLRVVPYANFFVGWDRPQSVARAGVAGGILRNTGINFETDALNGYATLDPTGNNTAGGSLGIDLLGDLLDQQLLLELSYLTPHGSGSRLAPGDQYAVGARYQRAMTYHSIWRFDTMYGWRDGRQDVYGTRMEYRYKF